MDSTKLTANELLAYQAISSFVSEANAVGGSTQKSLQLYNRLIQKTQISSLFQTCQRAHHLVRMHPINPHTLSKYQNLTFSPSS